MGRALGLTLAAGIMLPPLGASAQWMVHSIPDPMTDQQEVTAELRGEGGKIVFMCSRGNRSVLAFQPEAFLGGPIARYDWRDFSYRVDGAPAVTARWKYVDTYVAAPSNREIVQFFTAIAHGSTLRVRAISFDRSYVDATFSLSGTADAMRQTIQSCGG